jgi:dTDP-glucose pyrophosphorylase
MLAGIREVMLISSPDEINNFQRLFGNGKQFGIAIEYGVQEQPKGIAEGLLVAEKFITGQKVGFILGDNLFHGSLGSINSLVLSSSRKSSVVSSHMVIGDSWTFVYNSCGRRGLWSRSRHIGCSPQC